MKKVIPYILLTEGNAVYMDYYTTENPFTYVQEIVPVENPVEYCQALAGSGADRIFFFDLSDSEEEHMQNLEVVKKIAKAGIGSFTVGGSCKHIDDVKKYLYTGADQMFFVLANEGDSKKDSDELMKESLKRFGTERAAILVSTKDEAARAYALGFREFYCLNSEGPLIASMFCEPDYDEANIYCAETIKQQDKKGNVVELVSSNALEEGAEGLLYAVAEEDAGKVMDLKQELRNKGFQTEVFHASFAWEDLKKDDKGLVPVVVQDVENDEVLMVAYMNEESYNLTIKTGRMTYYSRSRQELWLKGETSGHYQYVKSLKIDCDQDTILARVIQIGAACHTGNRSCFYRDIVNCETPKGDSVYQVLEKVYGTIMDRKVHPKEGSYTNYLFDKGIDKILKKVGEEACEILIAAKNPDPNEIVYELGDFLYHAMVLMADKGVSWEDVARELANRE